MQGNILSNYDVYMRPPPYSRIHKAENLVNSESPSPSPSSSSSSSSTNMTSSTIIPIDILSITNIFPRIRSSINSIDKNFKSQPVAGTKKSDCNCEDVNKRVHDTIATPVLMLFFHAFAIFFIKSYYDKRVELLQCL